MVNWLRSVGVTPDILYALSMGSIVLSLVLWFLPRSGSAEERSRPERLAIFVGLWPPTLALLGHALREEEKPLA